MANSYSSFLNGMNYGPPTQTNALGNWGGSNESITAPLGSGMYDTMGSGWGSSDLVNGPANTMNFGSGMSGMTIPTASFGDAGGGGMFSGLNSWMKDSGFLGGMDKNGMGTQGWGSIAASGIGSGINALMGYGQMKQAQNQFNFQKDAWNKEYNNKTQSYNTQIADRQRARVASNPGAYQSEKDYLAAHALPNTKGY